LTMGKWREAKMLRIRRENRRMTRCGRMVEGLGVMRVT